MKRSIFLLTAFFALAIATDAQGLAVGSAIGNFSLPDLNGNTQALEHLKGKNGTVVIFLSAQCPVVKAYKDRINQIAVEAHGKGVNFIGINSNPAESVAAMKANAAAFGFRFPILHDKDTVVADRFDARTAPEVFFLNAENVLLYRGAIDNDHSGSSIGESFLTSAIEASLTGQPILRKSVMRPGCPIKRAGIDPGH
jgi:peroxiredoxin